MAFKIVFCTRALNTYGERFRGVSKCFVPTFTFLYLFISVLRYFTHAILLPGRVSLVVAIWPKDINSSRDDIAWPAFIRGAQCNVDLYIYK